MTTLILHRPHNVRFLSPTANSCLIPFPPLIAVCITIASGGWNAAQILTPILVGIVLCLAFALWFLYQTGRLSRLTSILPSMRRSRQARRTWTIDNDGPSSRALHHVPDAEATPMIDPVLHSRSLSPKDDATDRKRFSTRMGMGVVTPAFSNVICSIRRLFGQGPIKVSRVPVPDTFDLEDPVTNADPFDTPGSASSRSWTVGRNSDSTLDRIPSPHHLINKPSWSSAALEPVLDNGQENYDDTGNVFEDGGANDHDGGTNAGNGVILISKDGEDFSLTGSLISVPIGGRSIEVDRGSIEVWPPSPHTISKHVSKSVDCMMIHVRPVITWLYSLSVRALALQEVHLRPFFVPLLLKSLTSLPSRHPPMTYPTSVSTPFQNLLCHPHISRCSRPHRVLCNPLARMRLEFTSSRQRHRP
jgi:hypothetical protein